MSTIILWYRLEKVYVWLQDVFIALEVVNVKHIAFLLQLQWIDYLVDRKQFVIYLLLVYTCIYKCLYFW